MPPNPYWQPTVQDFLDMEDAAKASRTPSPVRHHSPEKGRASSHLKVGLGRSAVSSPLSNSIESPNLSDALSNVSSDSFDWIGDDRDENCEFEDTFGCEDEETAPQSGGAPVALRDSASSLANTVLLIYFSICLAIWSGHEIIKETPEVASVPLSVWAIFALLLVFSPIWAYTGLNKLSRYLQAHTFLSKTDHPTRLAAISLPLSIVIGSFLTGIFWIRNFPQTCVSPNVAVDIAENAPVIRTFCGFDYIPRLFLFFIVAGLVMSLGSLVMVIIRSSFQETSFKKRIVENQFKAYVVEQLLMAARHQRTARREERHEPKKRESSKFMFTLPFIVPEMLFQLGRQVTRSASRHSSDDHVASDFSEFRNEILHSMQSSGYESVATSLPRTDYQAKVMARMIFHYLCPSDRDYLTMEDFSTIITNETACRDAYYVFDADRDGTITKSEFKGALVRIFREQRNLAQSVSNTGSALSILDTISKVVSTIGLLLLLLAILGVKVQNILGLSASFVFAINFVIYDSANKTFNSLLFLFLIHPYDIGDRIIIGKEIGHNDEEVLIVLHINIQNTIFKRWNGLLVTIPNHVLAVGPLTNLSRGGEQWERVEFSLQAPDQKSPTVEEETERLSDLRRQIEKFLIAYRRDYFQSFELRALIAADNCTADKNFDTLKFILKVKCKETVDSQKKWTRHARLLAFVKQVVPSTGVKFAATAA